MAKFLDISAQRFGKLVALYFHESKGGYRYYICKCDCGNIKSIKRRLLVKGETASCGCEWRLANKNHNNWQGFGDMPKDFFSSVKRNANDRNIEFNNFAFQRRNFIYCYCYCYCYCYFFC